MDYKHCAYNQPNADAILDVTVGDRVRFAAQAKTRAPYPDEGHPLLRQGGIKFRGQAALVGEFAQQDPVRVADQTVSVRNP